MRLHRRMFNIVVAIVLAGAGMAIGVGAPAQAATTTICANLSVPAGWLIINAQQPPASCGYFARYPSPRTSTTA